MNRPLVIFHGACRDGFCALWVLHRKFGSEMDSHAGYYGQPPPDVAGRDVIIVDFSYPRDVMERMAAQASHLTVLDHHATAEEALRDFKPAHGEVVFDMHHSGAGIAWDHYFPGQPRHWLVDYVEDRDLWRHALRYTKTINAYIATLPFTFEAWDDASRLQAEGTVVQFTGDGAVRKTEQYVREVAKNARTVRFEGLTVPLVNAPQVDISELLDALCYDERAVEGVAMGWWQRADGVYQYSLRSRSTVDVSELAKRYGGGGHRQAAGFQSEVMLVLK